MRVPDGSGKCRASPGESVGLAGTRGIAGQRAGRPPPHGPVSLARAVAAVGWTNEAVRDKSYVAPRVLRQRQMAAAQEVADARAFGQRVTMAG